MAFLDLSDAFLPAYAQPALPPDDFVAEPVEPSSFDQTEWAVIALARHDNMATLREPVRSKISRLILGRPRTYMLSGERLEALRRLAVEAWHHPLSISLPTLGAFIAAGFTSGQLGLLLSATGVLPVMAGLSGASRNSA